MNGVQPPRAPAVYARAARVGRERRASEFADVSPVHSSWQVYTRVTFGAALDSAGFFASSSFRETLGLRFVVRLL